MKYGLFTVICIILIACNNNYKTPTEEDRQAIVQLHELQRDYHFNKDSIEFANQLSDEFISVNKGVISTPSREETISRYHGYFSAVEFIKWDDESPPIIRFSADGSMAYTIVDKIVKLTYQDQDGNTIQDETHFAWTSIYKKSNGQWKIDCVTSTDRPPGPPTDNI